MTNKIVIQYIYTRNNWKIWTNINQKLSIINDNRQKNTILLYISQKSYFPNYFIEPTAVARRVLWNKVCPSFCQSCHLSGYFLGIVSLIFSKFWHGARIPCEVVLDRARFSGKNFFAPRIGKMGPKWVRNRVFSICWKIWSSTFTEFDL